MPLISYTSLASLKDYLLGRKSVTGQNDMKICLKVSIVSFESGLMMNNCTLGQMMCFIDATVS